MIIPRFKGESRTGPGGAEEAFKNALDDDLNTPEAVAVLFGLAHDAHRGEVGAAQRLRTLAEVLGLLNSAPIEWFQKGAGLTVQAGDEDQERIERLVAQRQAARARKDFATADQIRQALLAEGIVLEDKEGITQWRRS